MSVLRLILSLLVAVTGCVPASHPDSDGILEQARAAYLAGDFAEAAIQLETARATGVGEPVAVETAWGLAALQAQQPLAALVHLRRAAFLRGTSKPTQLESAIDDCERALDLQPGASQPPGSSIGRAWGILVLAFLMQVGALLGIARRRALVVILLSGAVLGVYAASEISHSDAPAVVALAGQRLCSEPHQATAFGPALRPGTGLGILASSDRWCRVQVGEQMGWLPTESVASLAEHSPARR